MRIEKPRSTCADRSPPSSSKVVGISAALLQGGQGVPDVSRVAQQTPCSCSSGKLRVIAGLPAHMVHWTQSVTDAVPALRATLTDGLFITMQQNGNHGGRNRRGRRKMVHAGSGNTRPATGSDTRRTTKASGRPRTTASTLYGPSSLNSPTRART